MGVRYELVPYPALSHNGLYFEWRPVPVRFCDYCERQYADDQGMCRECWDAFETLANRISATTNMCLTVEQLAGLGYRPNYRRFFYGKPWHHHLPPHERKRYGLHAETDQKSTKTQVGILSPHAQVRPVEGLPGGGLFGFGHRERSGNECGGLNARC